MRINQIFAISAKRKRFATGFQYHAAALALVSFHTSWAQTQDEHMHALAGSVQEHQINQDQQRQANALVRIVRESTERFKDVSVAEAEGYALQFGCVSGDYSGAMGLHYVNGDLVSKGVLDATRPQIVIYEATPGGGRRLIGADYLLIADAGMRPILARRNSWDSSFTCSRAQIALGSRRSTRCMCGRGRRILRAPSSTGTQTFPANLMRAKIPGKGNSRDKNDCAT